MMSVGEQQRVAVARALANKPELLLADEPTANVDARHQKQIIDLIRETCREEKVALLLVTHTADVMAQFDRVENLEKINRAVNGRRWRDERSLAAKHWRLALAAHAKRPACLAPRAHVRTCERQGASRRWAVDGGSNAS